MSNIEGDIIIGGGIHGASLAFHLEEHGVKPLVLPPETGGLMLVGSNVVYEV